LSDIFKINYLFAKVDCQIVIVSSVYSEKHKYMGTGIISLAMLSYIAIFCSSSIRV